MPYQHHEYLGTEDLRKKRRAHYNFLYNSESNVGKYNSLFFHDKRPAPSGYNPRSHCFISYTDDFPVHTGPIKYKNYFKEAFNHKLSFEKMLKLIESFASISSLHDAYKKNGEMSDPVTIMFSEGAYHVVLGHHRFFLSKIMGIPLKAWIYTWDEYADVEMSLDIPDLQWNLPVSEDQVYLKPIIHHHDTSVHGFFRLCLAHRKDRDEILKKHDDHMTKFVKRFNDLGEEVIYHHKGKPILFLPAVNPLISVEVEVEDEFGIVQHCLHRYCKVKSFKMSRRFEEL